eukprot:scaffold1744_cov340-Prasinococcus_capsulatus_cf.AAC.23
MLTGYSPISSSPPPPSLLSNSRRRCGLAAGSARKPKQLTRARHCREEAGPQALRQQPPALLGQRHKLRGLPRRQRHRLLAQHVLARQQQLLRQRVVLAVHHAHVHHLHRRVLRQLVVALVRARHAVRRRELMCAALRTARHRRQHGARGVAQRRGEVVGDVARARDAPRHLRGRRLHRGSGVHQCAPGALVQWVVEGLRVLTLVLHGFRRATCCCCCSAPPVRGSDSRAARTAADTL